MTEPGAGGTADVLSQSEVESILAQIQAGEQQPVKVLGAEEGKTSAPLNIQPYDFRMPVYLTPSQMRRLRIKHEDFIRSLAASISLFLRADFSLQMSRLETMTYKSMLDILPMPSHLTLFRLTPLSGMCLFDIAPRLGLTILDRMMGGPGHSVKVEREFTDIEISVLRNFIKIVLKEYADSWLKYQPLGFDIVEHENTARFLQIVKPDEIMLYLEVEARFGDCVAGMRFMIPYWMMAPFVDSLMKEISSGEDTQVKRFKLPEDPTSPVYNVPVPITAHWRGLSMTLREVSELSAGDVLMLDPKAIQNVNIDLAGMQKFKADMDRTGPNVMLKLLAKTD